jgi:hypothetical protein
MIFSIIIDLCPICRRWDLSPGVNDSVRRLKLSRFGPSDLSLPDQSRIFSHGCREDVCPCNICPDCYVLDNDDSYSRLSNDVDQPVRFFSPGILVLVLLPMVIDYFNGCTRARSLGIAAQKIIEKPSLVFSGLWFVSIFGCLQKITRLCHVRRKSLKTSKIC